MKFETKFFHAIVTSKYFLRKKAFLDAKLGIFSDINIFGYYLFIENLKEKLP